MRKRTQRGLIIFAMLLGLGGSYAGGQAVGETRSQRRCADLPQLVAQAVAAAIEAHQEHPAEPVGPLQCQTVPDPAVGMALQAIEAHLAELAKRPDDPAPCCWGCVDQADPTMSTPAPRSRQPLRASLGPAVRVDSGRPGFGVKGELWRRDGRWTVWGGVFHVEQHRLRLVLPVSSSPLFDDSMLFEPRLVEHQGDEDLALVGASYVWTLRR